MHKTLEFLIEGVMNDFDVDRETAEYYVGDYLCTEQGYKSLSQDINANQINKRR